jgi:ABC-type nitrate/sulfonate/bicarbonate transport system substrate-binding protein
LALLHVVAESGAWEKHGLDVDYERKIGRSEAHDAVASGEIEFVGGNHVSTYGRRARGTDWVYLGQTMNTVYGRTLAVRADAGIECLSDLEQKTVGTLGAHPGLNDWLFLKQHGLDVGRDQVALLDIGKLHATAAEVHEFDLWHAVRDGTVDAAFLSPPATHFAAAAGLKLIATDPFPMIFFTTLSTSERFANAHPDIVDRFLKAMIEGIHFFKTQPARTIDILRTRYTKEGILDAAIARDLYESLVGALEPKLYPSLEAIGNVYQEGVRLDKDAAKINPLELWDLHFLRKLDDAGFINGLYAQPEVAISHAS